jgi:hypothetical protein
MEDSKMKLFSFFLLLITSLTVSASLTGKSIESPRSQHVEIFNKSVESRYLNFGIDEMFIVGWSGLPAKRNGCIIGSYDDSFKSKLTVIGNLSDGEYIFEYHREGTSGGAQCPSGVFFKGDINEVL